LTDFAQVLFAALIIATAGTAFAQDETTPKSFFGKAKILDTLVNKTMTFEHELEVR